MMSAVPRNSRTMLPMYAKRSEQMSCAIMGLRSLVLKDQVHHDIAKGLCSFALSGLVSRFHLYPGRAPWAAICRRFAANQLWYRSLREGCDGYNDAADR